MSRSVEKSGEKPSLAVLVAPHVCAGVPQLMVMGVTRDVAPSPPLRQTGGIFKGLFPSSASFLPVFRGQHGAVEEVKQPLGKRQRG